MYDLVNLKKSAPIAIYIATVLIPYIYIGISWMAIHVVACTTMISRPGVCIDSCLQVL